METSDKEERLWAAIAHLSAFAMYLTAIKANEGVSYRYPLTLRLIS